MGDGRLHVGAVQAKDEDAVAAGEVELDLLQQGEDHAMATAVEIINEHHQTTIPLFHHMFYGLFKLLKETLCFNGVGKGVTCSLNLLLFSPLHHTVPQVNHLSAQEQVGGVIR